MTDATVIVPQARVWDCQQPTSDDANQWVVVSSNMILDQHNCTWLMQYPHEVLGGGSMWAVHLPAAIPAARRSGRSAAGLSAQDVPRNAPRTPIGQYQLVSPSGTVS